MADQNDRYEHDTAKDIAENEQAMGWLKDLQRITEIANEENGRKTVTEQPAKKQNAVSEKQAAKKQNAASEKEPVKKQKVTSEKEPVKKQKADPEKQISKASGKQNPEIKNAGKQDPEIKTEKISQQRTGRTEEKAVSQKPRQRENNDNLKQKKKLRRKKPFYRKHPKLFGFFILVLILAVLALVAVFGFSLKNVVIEGNERVTEEEICTIIGRDSCNDNTLLLWLKDRKIDVSDNDMISSIDVTIKDMHTVTVKVREQVPVGCFELTDGYAFVNHEGYVIMEKTDNSDGVPLVTGLDVDTANVGEYIETSDEDTLKCILDIADYIESYGLDIESVNASSDDTFTLTYKKVTIELGKINDMEDKISGLSDLFSELGSMSGTLHLENYDSSKDTITFTKD